MTLKQRLFAMLLIVPCVLASAARAQDDTGPKADPAALKAFAEIVQSYRQRPALTVKSTVKIEMAQGETAAKGSEVKGEFTFGQKRQAVIKLNGLVYYLSRDADKPETEPGIISVIHEKNEKAYFSGSDDGSPYYALLNAVKDMPFPELAIELGEDSIDDVLLQFHPKALSGVVPTAVESMEKDGKTLQRLTLAGENEKIEMWVDPETKLIQSLDLQISGGGFVQPGVTVAYKHSYEYQTHDKPLNASTFKFEPGQRQRVDMVASLIPAPAAPQGEDGEEGGAAGALVGQAAPGFVLSTADGGAVDLEDLQGKVVVLDFWASWCGPCMAALPKLHQAAKWASDEQLPVVVYTINVWELRQDDTPDGRLESAKNTWKRRGFTLPIAMDYTDETAKSYHVSGIPTTVVIRADGVVHAVHSGAGGDYVEQLKGQIQEAMKAIEQ